MTKRTQISRPALGGRRRLARAVLSRPGIGVDMVIDVFGGQAELVDEIAGRSSGSTWWKGIVSRPKRRWRPKTVMIYNQENMFACVAASETC